jgi:BirA family biotin operon repressor/biotin-[acetyl-CoA-carboxylase] ligase
MTDLPPDLAEAIGSARNRLGPYSQLQFFSEVDSTNDIALALAARGAPEGTSVLADVQHAGRGRRGRVWFSPPGAGLYLSIVVRPVDGSTVALMSLAAGVGGAAAIASATGLPVELKWPNDIVIGRPWRKLGGILCESAGVGASVDAVVIGVGINVRSAAYPPEIADRATSVEAEIGRHVDRAPIVVACLAEVRRSIAELHSGGRARVISQWRDFGKRGLFGARVRWTDRDGERGGIARDIDDDGALLVQSDARLERLVAGEVIWERLSDG